MIKILFIITNLNTGGAEMMLYKLIQNMDRTRFQPMVISLMGKGEVGPRIESQGVTVQELGMRREMPNPLHLLRLVFLLRQFQPDVVHTWMYHADLLGGLCAYIAGFRKIIWCIRHSNLSRSESKRSTLWVAQACAKLSSIVPTRIITCSKIAKEIHADLGYQANKIDVIPNGFDLSRFQPSTLARTSVRNELGLPKYTLLVGLVARFDPQKNHIGFVNAVAQVNAQLPQVHFLLVGHDVDFSNAQLRTAIASYPKLAANIHLLGRRDDIPRLMAALDVLVSSSSFGEGFPNVLGEAMACGLPCVVTDVGDSAYIVAETGRVVPVIDMEGLARELVAVLQLPVAQRRALGHQARVRVQSNFEIGHVTKMYESVYERVAKHKLGL